MEFRIETDTMGSIQVPKERYWGAQTQRSLEHFKIGTEKIPLEVIYAFAVLKKAAAATNYQLGVLSKQDAQLIATVCDEITSGQHDAEFPLAVWQTGSGTQSNMNVNEVIANRANDMAGCKQLHPNDHVNRSQSSNDTFPTAMHIASAYSIHHNLLPALDEMMESLHSLQLKNEHVIKIGRTHLQDAVPLTFGQEVSAWKEMMVQNKRMIEDSLQYLYPLALGGTAVGTGLNAPPCFAECVAEKIAAYTHLPFVTAENKFHALSSKDALVFVHGALKALAANLMKIANDVRWLSSGPRCGLGEIFIPENEPGSSIMPGKVNPTQCEAVTMVAVQVISNDTAIALAASQGNFQLNVFMPVCIYNMLQSIRLLSDGIHSFTQHCLNGITVHHEKMDENVHRSLMLVTCLTPHISYEKAAIVAKKAYKEQLTLKEACVALQFLTPEQFDEAFRIDAMI